MQHIMCNTRNAHNYAYERTCTHTYTEETCKLVNISTQSHNTCMHTSLHTVHTSYAAAVVKSTDTVIWYEQLPVRVDMSHTDFAVICSTETVKLLAPAVTSVDSSAL